MPAIVLLGLKSFLLGSCENPLWYTMQKLYEELVHYRTEYISAAERLCAYRNVSKLADVGSCLFVYTVVHAPHIPIDTPPHTIHTTHS